jgi:hydroxypyruvate reductase/glycerate 2-kinase
MNFIKNRKNLLEYHDFQSVLDSLDALEFAFRRCSPENLVGNSISMDRGMKIRDINGNITKFPHLKSKSVMVISVGKASERMLLGLHRKLSSRIGKSLLISPEGYSLPVNSQKRYNATIIQSSHPIPNENSEAASKLAISFLRNLESYDLVIFLISGGASSLIVSPATGLTLFDKKEISKILVSSGADIREINVVRKHMSQIKGGNILRFLQPKKKILTLLLSDVVGDNLDTIGSGMTFYDKSTFNDALGVMKKYRLDMVDNYSIQKVCKYFANAAKHMSLETLKQNEFETFDVSNCIIGNNAKFCDSIAEYLLLRGYDVIYKGSEREGNVEDFSIYFRNLIDSLSSNTALVMGGEITNFIDKSKLGKGGRNQEAICRILKLMGNFKSNDYAIICIGTDGIDGNSDSAGGIISPNSTSFVSQASLDIDSYLSENNSNVLLRNLNSVIHTGYTGTNFNDIYLIVKLK